MKNIKILVCSLGLFFSMFAMGNDFYIHRSCSFDESYTMLRLGIVFSLMKNSSIKYPKDFRECIQFRNKIESVASLLAPVIFFSPEYLELIKQSPNSWIEQHPPLSGNGLSIPVEVDGGPLKNRHIQFIKESQDMFKAFADQEGF